MPLGTELVVPVDEELGRELLLGIELGTDELLGGTEELLGGTEELLGGTEELERLLLMTTELEVAQLAAPSRPNGDG